MTEPTTLVATWSDGLFALHGDGRRHELANQAVRGLASDGRGGALAIVGQHALCRRTYGGEWKTLATSDLELSCCMAVHGTIYAGTDGARVLRLNGSGNAGVFEPLNGFDETAGRETWFAGSAVVNGQRMGPPLGIRSVAANADGSVLFANVHVGGIPRSLDGGRTWQPTIDIHSDVHEVRGHQTDPAIAAAASALGVCISRDAGATWTIEREGLHGLHCSAVAFSGNDILFSAAASHFAAEGRIYRRRLRPEGAIEALTAGMPAFVDGITDTGCIAVMGQWIAIADRAGSLYGSDNAGQTWSRRVTGLPSPSGVLVCEA